MKDIDKFQFCIENYISDIGTACLLGKRMKYKYGSIHIDKSPYTDYNGESLCTDSCFAFNRSCKETAIWLEVFMSIRNYIELIEQQRKEQDAIYHNVAVKYGLSDTAMWVLYNIYIAEETITQQELCRQCFFAKQTVNTAITSLVKNGYVELESIIGTRNHKRILLTEKGIRLADETIKPLVEAEDKAYAVLDSEEIKAYLEMTTRLTVSLREETGKL